MTNHSTKISKENQKQTQINKETQQRIQTETEIGTSGGSYKLSDGVQAELRRMNTNMEKMLGCFYRMMHDRGKEHDHNFNGRIRELGDVGHRDHRIEIENQNLQSKFSSHFRGLSMESEASRQSCMVNLNINGDSKSSRQNTNSKSDNLEAKIQALQNLVNRSPIGDEGMRNCDSFVTCDDILEKFHVLKQVGTVNDYLLQFEKLKNVILATRNWSLTEEFLVQNFTNGLKQDIREKVETFSSYSLPETIMLAKLQEGYVALENCSNVLVVAANVDRMNTGGMNQIVAGLHGAIGKPEVQLSDFVANGLKINCQHANLGKDMAVVETEDVVTEAQVTLVNEELGNASNGMNCGAANGINRTEVGTGDFFVDSSRKCHVARDKHAHEFFGESWSATGNMNLMRQSLHIQLNGAKSYSAGNKKWEWSDDCVAGFIPNIGMGEGHQCLEVDVQNLEKEEPKEEDTYVNDRNELDLDAKNVDWKYVNIEHIKIKLISVNFEDPFYDSSNPVQIHPEFELLLAVGIAIPMVEVKGWLAFECVVCMLVLRPQDMCVAAEIGVQWLRELGRWP